MQPSETGRHARRVGRHRRGLRGTETASGSNSLPPRAWTKWLAVALVDQPEQREQPAPAAAPLVHGVGIERGVLGEPGIEAAHRIARSRRSARARPSVRDGRRSRSSA